VVKPGSKYFGLYEHLYRNGAESATLTFEEIEQLLGSELPRSARTSRAFWSNRRRGGLQASAWMEAGYHVVDADLGKGRVEFARPVLRYTVRREGDTVVWDSALVRALRHHLHMNQAELAQLLGVRQQTVSEWERGVYSPTRSRSKHLTLVAEHAGFPFDSNSGEDGAAAA
jgi:hypothetical protein